MTTFDLELRTRTGLHAHPDPDRYVSEYDAVVRCTDDAGEQVEAGRVRGLRVHAGLAANDGYDLFDVCDAHSDELAELHGLLYEPGDHMFRDAMIDRFQALDCDLLVLDYVVLDPRWRGLRLGLLAARRFADLLSGGCGLVVSHVAPLRRDAHRAVGVPADWLPRLRTRAARAGATRALRGYFRRMGFARLGRTRFYAMPTALVTPSGEELLRGGRPRRG